MLATQNDCLPVADEGVEVRRTDGNFRGGRIAGWMGRELPTARIHRADRRLVVQDMGK